MIKTHRELVKEYYLSAECVLREYGKTYYQGLIIRYL